MRALTERATRAERAAVDAWVAASPGHARLLRELRRMLAVIDAWYRATPLRAAPHSEILMRRAERRQSPNERLPMPGDE